MVRYSTPIRLLRIVRVSLFVFGVAASIGAEASCFTYGPAADFAISQPRILIPADVRVGDVVGESRTDFLIEFSKAPELLRCSRDVPRDHIPAYHNNVYIPAGYLATTNPSIKIEMSLILPEAHNYGPDMNNSAIRYELPSGTLTRPFPATLILKYIVTSLPVPSTSVTVADRPSLSIRAQQPIKIFRVPAITPITTTCKINALSVPLDAAGIRSFSGPGTVSSVAAKNFMIPLQCSGNSGARRVGVKFSSAYRDTSAAPGVIKVDQGAGMASGIGLKIVNGTTQLPISFDQLEPGPTPLPSTGINNYPFSVQYFQTSANVTVGRVVGRAEVSVAYE